MQLMSAAILLIIACGLGGCFSNSSKKSIAHKTTSQTAKITLKDTVEIRQEVWFQAFSLIGTPYRYGGSDRHGFDCSGMVQYVYQQATQAQLPRTAKDIASSSHLIPRSKLKSGDLVFFNTGNGPHSHVGIYLGNQEFLHAPSSNGVIRVARLDNAYFAPRFTEARTFMP